MTRRMAQSLPQGLLGVLGPPHPVTRQRQIDPGIDPAGPPPDRLGKGLIRPHRIAQSQPGLAIRIMRISLGRIGMARVRGRHQRLLPLARVAMPRKTLQRLKRRGIVGGGGLRGR